MGKFVFNDPPKKSPVRIEQVFAEKPGGGVVHVTEDMPATTPVSLREDGTYGEGEPQVVAHLSTRYVSGNPNLWIEENTVKAGDFITVKDGTYAREVISVSKDEWGYKITIGSGISGSDLSRGEGIFKAVSKDKDYQPAEFFKPAPAYITGNDLKAADGEYQPVRLINGANVRKETAVITEEQAEKMSGIHLV